MSNVIQFLEAMGSNAALGRLPAADYAATIAVLDADAAQQRALLSRDHAALNNLLEGRAKMFCMIATPDENSQEISSNTSMR